MGKERLELKDAVSVRLYDKNGRLIAQSNSNKQESEPFLERILQWVVSVISGDDPG